MYARKIRRTCLVATVGSTQSFALYRPQPGERIRAASLKSLTSAGAGRPSTWSLGDGASGTRFLNAVTAVQAVGALVDGTLAGGFLYTSQDTITLLYTANAATGATPAVEAMLEVESVYPRTN